MTPTAASIPTPSRFRFVVLAGQWGVILGSGEALSVRRNDGRRTFVTTVEDAATAGGLLNAMVAERS